MLFKYCIFFHHSRAIGNCYRLNVYHPEKFICWNLILKVIDSIWKCGFGWWLDYKSGACEWDSCFYKISESCLTPFAVWGCSMRTAICEPGGSPTWRPNLPAPWSWLPSPRTGRNKFVLLTSHPAMVFLFSQPEQT